MFLSEQALTHDPWLQEKQDTEELLRTIEELALAADLPSIMTIALRGARAITQADGVSFVLKEEDRCFYADENTIAPLWKGQRFPMSICISGWVMTHGQPVVIDEIYADSRIPEVAYRPTFVKSLAMVPIRAHDPIGAIGSYWAQQYQTSEKQMNLLNLLSEATALTMECIGILQPCPLRETQPSVHHLLLQRMMMLTRELAQMR